MRPSMTSCLTHADLSAVRVLSRLAALTLRRTSASTWSRISAMSGEMTKVKPYGILIQQLSIKFQEYRTSKQSAGIWNVRLLPPVRSIVALIYEWRARYGGRTSGRIKHQGVLILFHQPLDDLYHLCEKFCEGGKRMNAPAPARDGKSRTRRSPSESHGPCP